MNNLHSGDDPFRLWIRREDGYDSTCTVRFETEHGRAVLGLRAPGRDEPEPTSHFEEMGIKADILRGGRFVHVLPGGQRRSYALSRLSVDLIDRLGSSSWVELEPVTEHGFRYLVFPRELPLEDPGHAPPAAVAPPGPTAPRPAPVARASTATPTPSGALPPRQTPMAPELAHEALSQLSPQAALQHLKMEMAKVDALHRRVDELERKLAASMEREQDLLELLQKWQSII